MAKKERQKRSARQARQAERAEHEAVVVQNAVARGEDPEAAKAALKKEPAAKVAKSTDNPGLFKRIANWFAGVAQEMRRVVWPTRKELVSYSLAVIGLLISFGLVVWAVDTAVVAGLVQYSKLRPGYTEPTAITTVDSTADDATTEVSAEDATEGAAEGTEATTEDAEASAEAAPETTEATSAAEAETPEATTEGSEG